MVFGEDTTDLRWSREVRDRDQVPPSHCSILLLCTRVLHRPSQTKSQVTRTSLLCLSVSVFPSLFSHVCGLLCWQLVTEALLHCRERRAGVQGPLQGGVQTGWPQPRQEVYNTSISPDLPLSCPLYWLFSFRACDLHLKSTCSSPVLPT